MVYLWNIKPIVVADSLLFYLSDTLQMDPVHLDR